MNGEMNAEKRVGIVSMLCLAVYHPSHADDN